MTNVTLIVPTRHEAPTVTAIATRATAVLHEVADDVTVLFVDDSDDDTAQVIAGLASSRHDVALLHRAPGDRRGGLAGAVAEGFAASSGEVVAVMDGDLQHPPEALRELLRPLLDGRADVAIGSRFVGAGHADGLAGLRRRLLSRGAGLAARVAVRRARGVHDPLSGFFAVRREVVDGVELRADGFKILLELLAAGRWSHVVEVPYGFEGRTAGASKATLGVGLRYLRQLLRLCHRPTPAPPELRRHGTLPAGELAELLAGARAGSDGAFARLHAALDPGLRRYLATRTAAADEVAAAAWRRFGRLVGELADDERTVRVALAGAALAALAEHPGGPPDADAAGPELRQLRSLLRPDELDVVAMQACLGLDGEAVALLTGRSVELVVSLQQRAVDRLTASTGVAA